MSRADFVRDRAGAGRLRAQLRAELVRLGVDATQLAESEPLLASLASLYPVPARRVWREFIAPFAARHHRALRQIYAEHREFPEADVLSYVESLMMLERLAADAERLAHVWVLPPESLSRVSGAWGITPPKAA